MKAKKQVEETDSRSQKNAVESNLLSKIRNTNRHRLIVVHINISSLKKKFESLPEIIKTKVDILLILETTLDIFFPTWQFRIDYSL